MDRIEQKYMQKCENGGRGAGRGRGMEQIREGIENLGKQCQWIYNGRGGCW